jgi:hypothetical protein
MRKPPHGPRTRVLVQLRVEVAERARWARVAAAESLRLGELCREAIRAKIIELERHRLLANAAEPTEQAPPAPTKAVG